MRRTVYVAREKDLPIFGPSGVELQGGPFRDPRLGHGNVELRSVMLPESWIIGSLMMPNRWMIIDREDQERAIISDVRNLDGIVLIWPLQRFRVAHHHMKGGHYVGVASDGGKIVFSTDPLPPPEKSGGLWTEGDPEEIVKEWLNEHKPGWRIPGAFW